MSIEKESNNINFQRPYGVPALLEGIGDLEGLFSKLERIRERTAQGLLAGIGTDIASIDKHMSGFQNGLHILAAEPAAGKTTLALQFALKAAEDGATVLYFALDETADRLAIKLATRYAWTERHSDIMNGSGNLDKVREAVTKHRERLDRIRIYGDSKIETKNIGTMIQELKEIKQCSEVLVVVDFIQSMAARLIKGGDFRMAVTNLVGDLRDISRIHQVPILAIAAQNRGSMNEAKMSSLRESSDLEYGADTIIFLTNDKDDFMHTSEKRTVTLTCVKNRYGALFETHLTFLPARGVFTENDR
jgi:replicative DNA helicase